MEKVEAFIIAYQKELDYIFCFISGLCGWFVFIFFRREIINARVTMKDQRSPPPPSDFDARRSVRRRSTDIDSLLKK